VQQPPATPAPPIAASSADVEYPTGKSKGGLIAAIVVLVAIVGAAGAYFGGVIPH
jgi:hypothetical protein